MFAQVVSSFGLMVEVDWSTLFKTFYETVRVKVACRDHRKIPQERLYEMNKKLHVVTFIVEVDAEESSSKQDGGGPDGGNDGRDDYGNGDHKGADMDEEADDLYDTDGEPLDKDSHPSNIESGKTPNQIQKHSGKQGSKTICMSEALKDPLSQEKKLKECMEQNTIVSTAGDQELQLVSEVVSFFEVGGSSTQNSIDANLNSGVCTPTGMGKGLELELPSQNYTMESTIASVNRDDTTLDYCQEMNEWVTPECLLSHMLECHIVGNKFQSFLSDDDQKSKWEQFRKQVKSDIANEECSKLLRRMEL